MNETTCLHHAQRPSIPDLVNLASNHLRLVDSLGSTLDRRYFADHDMTVDMEFTTPEQVEAYVSNGPYAAISEQDIEEERVESKLNEIQMGLSSFQIYLREVEERHRRKEEGQGTVDDDDDDMLYQIVTDPPLRLDRHDFAKVMDQSEKVGNAHPFAFAEDEEDDDEEEEEVTPSFSFSRSAMDFVQLLVEDFHFGFVLEIPIQTKKKKKNDDDSTSCMVQYKGTSWILVGPHGSLAVSVQSDLMTDIMTNESDDDDDDSEYTPMEEEEESF